MSAELIADHGNGPAVAGTRITVYHLVPYFLDPTATEDYLCKLYDLTPAQVAAARAFVLNNADTVLAQHMKIEERFAAGNPPEVAERAKEAMKVFLGDFKKWLDQKKLTDANAPAVTDPLPGGIPSFREWFAAKHGAPAGGQ